MTTKKDNKIITIIGARPQFIKASTVSRIIRSNNQFKEILIHTGQHYDQNMSDVFFTQLDIPEPDYNLSIGSASHGVQTGRMLEAIEAVLLKERPNMVLVYGDTNSTLAGALAAVKLHIPIAHVEAGLRSFNRKMPEEINRILTDHTSDLLFAPTETAVTNLYNEGLNKGFIYNVGDVMYDAALYFSNKANNESSILNELKLESKQYVLSTLHRAENTDNIQRIKTILGGLEQVAQNIDVVLPIHPRTKKIIENNGLGYFNRRLKTIEPLGYLDMVMLEKNAALIATDSGGVQKEAFFHKVPCITLRDETEWVELVNSGWNQVVSPKDPQIIANSILSSLNKKGDLSNPYGNGHAAEKIHSIIGRII